MSPGEYRPSIRGYSGGGIGDSPESTFPTVKKKQEITPENRYIGKGISMEGYQSAEPEGIFRMRYPLLRKPHRRNLERKFFSGGVVRSC